MLNWIERNVRLVDEEVWRLSDLLRERRRRLLQPPDPVALLHKVGVEAWSAAAAYAITLKWQSSDDFPGYSRLMAKVPLREETFDQLFNGRSGYRAQYYLSPEEGVMYNHDVLMALLPALEQAFLAAPLGADWAVVRRSLAGPHAKVWVFDEKKAFDESAGDTLNPPRWVENGATRGRRAPLPEDKAIDVKGVFIHPERLDYEWMHISSIALPISSKEGTHEPSATQQRIWTPAECQSDLEEGWIASIL